MELLSLKIFSKMRLRKFYYRSVTVPHIGIKNLVSKFKCIDLVRFFVTELGLKLDISNEAKLKLANSRLDTNSKEAIALLLQLEALIPTGEEAYFNVVNLLNNYQYMLKVTKNPSKYKEYCAWIKQEYKRRRKLLDIMAESGF